jgi:two-component system response regulator GlrR
MVAKNSVTRTARTPASQTPAKNKVSQNARAAQNTQPTDRVLVIAGDTAAQRVTASRVSSAGYRVDAVASAEGAWAACAERCPDLVILDLDVQRAGGLALLRELKETWPDLLIIAVTNLMNLEMGVRATQCGAFSYLVKPVEKAELLGHVRRAIGAAAAAPKEHDWRADLAARGQLRETRVEQFNEVAGRDTHVLLTGESSLGRELLARALHAASSRRDCPFIVLRCGSGSAGEFLPDPEHLNGAMSKALSRAQRGTFLIDEIDCLPESTQLVLVAALGDVRVIATSALDARDLIQSDLLHPSVLGQIAAQTLITPPLGRRREDIPLLISHFLEQVNEPGGTRRLYSPSEVAALIAKTWPTNMRELFELVYQSTGAARGTARSGSQPTESSFDEAREDFSRQYLSETLRRTEGNVSKSARLAKRNRTDFYKLMEKYRLRPDDFKVAQTEH